MQHACFGLHNSDHGIVSYPIGQSWSDAMVRRNWWMDWFGDSLRHDDKLRIPLIASICWVEQCCSHRYDKYWVNTVILFIYQIYLVSQSCKIILTYFPISDWADFFHLVDLGTCSHFIWTKYPFSNKNRICLDIKLITSKNSQYKSMHLLQSSKVRFEILIPICNRIEVDIDRQEVQGSAIKHANTCERGWTRLHYVSANFWTISW